MTSRPVEKARILIFKHPAATVTKNTSEAFFNWKGFEAPSVEVIQLPYKFTSKNKFLKNLNQSNTNEKKINDLYAQQNKSNIFQLRGEMFLINFLFVVE